MKVDNRKFKLINLKENDSATAKIKKPKRQTTENKQKPTSKTYG